MKILAFDCSSAVGSVAALDGEDVIFSESFACPRGRGGELFGVLERAVGVAGTFDRIVAGIGPGSYNGLRVAVAAAEGLAIATGADLIGLESVRALPCPRDEYVAISDARGGVFYFVRVHERQIEGDFELLPEEALRERLAGLIDWDLIAPAPLEAFPGAHIATPDAVILARLAKYENPATNGLAPIYLKPPHITAPRPRR